MPFPGSPRRKLRDVDFRRWKVFDKSLYGRLWKACRARSDCGTGLSWVLALGFQESTKFSIRNICQIVDLSNCRKRIAAIFQVQMNRETFQTWWIYYNKCSHKHIQQPLQNTCSIYRRATVRKAGLVTMMIEPNIALQRWFPTFLDSSTAYQARHMFIASL